MTLHSRNGRSWQGHGRLENNTADTTRRNDRTTRLRQLAARAVATRAAADEYAEIALERLIEAREAESLPGGAS